MRQPMPVSAGAANSEATSRNRQAIRNITGTKMGNCNVQRALLTLACETSIALRVTSKKTEYRQRSTTLMISGIVLIF